MYRAINTNSRIYRLQKVLSVLQKEICNTLQISPKTQEICNALQIFQKSFVYLQRISFLAIKIECKMNSKVNKENMCSTGLWNAMIRQKNKTHTEKQ